MKRLFLALFSIILLISGCGQGKVKEVNTINNDLLEYETSLKQSNELAQQIASNLVLLDNIEQVVVQLRDKYAVIGINLAYEHSNSSVIKLKKDIADNLKSIYPFLKHVAITTTPSTYEKIVDLPDSHNTDSEQERIKKKLLEKNNNEEIFMNVSPNL